MAPAVLTTTVTQIHSLICSLVIGMMYKVRIPRGVKSLWVINKKVNINKYYRKQNDFKTQHANECGEILKMKDEAIIQM